MKPTLQPINSNDVRALREIISNWQNSLTELERADDDQVVAGNMVGALLAADYSPEALYEIDPLVMEVFDHVTELETPLVPETERQHLWTETKKGVAQLGQKYLKPDRS